MDGGPAAAGQVGAYTRQHLILDRPGLLPYFFFSFLKPPPQCSRRVPLTFQSNIRPPFRPPFIFLHFYHDVLHSLGCLVIAAFPHDHPRLCSSSFAIPRRSLE